MSGVDSEGVDVVIVNYRTPDDFEECLRSLADNPPVVAHRVHLVNVCPTIEDHRVADVWAAKLPVWSVCEYMTNVGYARAVNHAASRAHRQVIAAFNADIVFTAGAVDACYQALMAHDDWGVLGPRQIDDHGRFTHAGIFGTHAAPKHRGWHEPDSGQYRDVAEAITVSGSAYFAKRTMWEELTRCPIYQSVARADGAFLPTQHYYEETACSYHAHAHGWKVIYYGAATVVHKWHRASPVGGPADRHMPESRELFRRFCDAHNIPRD